MALLAASAAFASDIDAQRQAFIDAWPVALDGGLPTDREQRRLLKTYPLWPDLQAAVYSATLATTPSAEIEQFMQQHAALAPIRRLRYRYVSHLGRSAQWQRFLKHYNTHYAQSDLPPLDCLALRAHIATGQSADALGRRLWLVGRSQHDFCDPAFATLKQRGFFTEALIRERLHLAIDARQFGLASYLAGMLDSAAADAVARWQRALGNPQQALADPRRYSSQQLTAAARKLALRDAPAASRGFANAARAIDFDDEQRGAVLRTIGIASAQDNELTAAELLAAVPDSHRDVRVMEWQTRTAMREDRWRDVLRLVASMPMSAQSTDRWRYWEARALQASGQTDAARGLLSSLATERSYHGFLAADALGLDYAFDHQPLNIDQTTLDALAAEPSIIRARELRAVGQLKRGAEEWRRAVRTRSTDEKRAAAMLAHRWQWHREAIALLGELKAWDDLDMRYPLAFAKTVEQRSEAVGISASLALGILRSESLYDHEARSSAGAWGLMQIMPATGRRVARQTGLRWRGIETLKTPADNITLGTHYLAGLLDRFGQPALAAAAYNAGPHRVERWLPQAGSVPADIWIETIAYDETRAYVQRVLAAQSVFRWRTNAPQQRLSDILSPVAAKQRAVASLTGL